MPKRFALLGILLLLVPVAAAQDLMVKAPPQRAPIWILNATVHPVSSPSIDRAHVLLRDGRIADVRTSAPTPAPDERVVDAEGLHLYPGLIGAVTQLGLTEISAVRASRDFNEVGRFSPEAVAATAINPDSTLLPVTRSSGILTVGVFPTGGLLPGSPSIINLEGWTSEDLTVLDRAGLIVSWPQPRPALDWWLEVPRQEQQKVIDEDLRALDTFFRNAMAYHAQRDADPSSPIDVRYEAAGICLPGAEPQRPVFLRAQDVDQITHAVRWADELGLRLVIVGGRDAELCAESLTRHDVPVLITGTHTFPKRADAPHDDPFTLPARLESLGVRWALASSEEPAHERNLPYHAGTAVAYGLDHDVAVRSITLSAAQLLGVDDRLGSIEPGKHATLILTDGSPLETTTRTVRAFIQGREIDLNNKQTALAEKYREKYRQLDTEPRREPDR